MIQFHIGASSLIVIHQSNILHSNIRKLDKSWEACNAQGISFLPLAAESLGSWHQSAIAEIKKLGSAHARHTGEEEYTGISRLFQ